MEEKSKELVEEYINEYNKFDISEETIEKYCNLASFFNRIYTESDIGDFRDRENFEASFISRNYIEEDLEFIINLYVKHSKGHCFHNGNKRTATHIFSHLLNLITPYKIYDEKDLIQSQEEFVDNRISENNFIEKLKNNLEITTIKNSEKVKLEKLIERGDVTEENGNNNNRKVNFTLNDLKEGDIFFKQLRKPYFQRDTNSWTVEKIEKLLNSYVEDMLVPAIILWNSKENGIFIVDGAHRVSALAAWVNDNYGKSVDYKKHIQIKKYIDEKIGNYKEIIKSESDKYKKIQNNIALKAINIEWINGNYEMVKNSFIRINEQGVVITLDEKEIIKNDDTAISKLSRAILVYSGGQKNKTEDARIKNIFNKLFLPKYDKVNKVVPMCGDLYDDYLISRVFNLLKTIDNNRNLSFEELLLSIEKVIDFIVDKLEINNRVYFYGISYQYKQSALVGITKFLMELSEKNEIDKFIKAREKFELYLVNNPEDIQNIVRKRRQVKNSIEDIVNYYNVVLDSVISNNSRTVQSEISYLGKIEKTDRMKKMGENYRKEIGALKKCNVCGGYLNNYSKNNFHEICKNH